MDLMGAAETDVSNPADCEMSFYLHSAMSGDKMFSLHNFTNLFRFFLYVLHGMFRKDKQYDYRWAL